jgi:hypothetical protein
VLHLSFHDLGTGQRISGHHPLKRLPRHLPASTAVQPVTPGAFDAVIHQVHTCAVPPNAVVLVVAAPFGAERPVRLLERSVAVGAAPAPKRTDGASEPFALRLAFDGEAACAGFAPVVDKTQEAERPGLAAVRPSPWAPEVDQLGLFGVDLQPILGNAFG